MYLYITFAIDAINFNCITNVVKVNSFYIELNKYYFFKKTKNKFYISIVTVGVKNMIKVLFELIL
jgi:hypothetical protein